MNQRLKPAADKNQSPDPAVDPADILYSIDLGNAPNENFIHPRNISNNHSSNGIGADIFKPDDLKIDVRGVPEYYRADDDSYKPFTIYGNHGELGFD